MLGLLGVMREVVGGLKIGVLLPGTDRVIATDGTLFPCYFPVGI